MCWLRCLLDRVIHFMRRWWFVFILFHLISVLLECLIYISVCNFWLFKLVASSHLAALRLYPLVPFGTFRFKHEEAACRPSLELAAYIFLWMGLGPLMDRWPRRVKPSKFQRAGRSAWLRSPIKLSSRFCFPISQVGSLEAESCYSSTPSFSHSERKEITKGFPEETPLNQAINN